MKDLLKDLQHILVFNPGSSSLRFALFENVQDKINELLKGELKNLNSDLAPISANLSGALSDRFKITAGSFEIASEQILDQVANYHSSKVNKPLCVACRVVHGGSVFTNATEVTQSVIDQIEEFNPLAPLHNPISIGILRRTLAKIQNVNLYAAFDTAFHQSMPAIASTYAIAPNVTQRFGIKRYGFHGIAHQYVSQRILSNISLSSSQSRLVTCHLGSGASVCAIKNGASEDTSMGFTPLEGVMMAHRSGDIDPGILLHLMQNGYSTSQLNDLLSKQSGVLALYQQADTVETVEKNALAGDSLAIFVLECFAYRVVKYIGAYAAVLGGIDALGFSGGIGENSAFIRSLICKRLKFLGIEISEQFNSSHQSKDEGKISSGKVEVWVIPAREEAAIASNIIANYLS